MGVEFNNQKVIEKSRIKRGNSDMLSFPYDT